MAPGAYRRELSPRLEVSGENLQHQYEVSHNFFFRCTSAIGRVWIAGRHGGSMVARQTVVLGSTPVSPQPTADCHSAGGLPPGMALGCRLTSVMGNRGENYKKWTAGCQKHLQKKRVRIAGPIVLAQHKGMKEQAKGGHLSTALHLLLLKSSNIFAILTINGNMLKTRCRRIKNSK